MDSMNGPSMITGVPKSGRERTRERAAQGGIGPTFPALQMEEGALSSGIRQPLEALKGRETGSPLQSPGGTQPQ